MTTRRNARHVCVFLPRAVRIQTSSTNVPEGSRAYAGNAAGSLHVSVMVPLRPISIPIWAADLGEDLRYRPEAKFFDPRSRSSSLFQKLLAMAPYEPSGILAYPQLLWPLDVNITEPNFCFNRLRVAHDSRSKAIEVDYPSQRDRLRLQSEWACPHVARLS